jgi:hypothetical protein
LLPDNVPGFVADPPEGNTLTVSGLQLVDAVRVYYRGQRSAAATWCRSRPRASTVKPSNSGGRRST